MECNLRFLPAMKRITALVVVASCLTGCGGYGGDGTNVPPSSADVNGSWSGTIEFHNIAFPTTVDMFIVQSGTTLSSGTGFVQFNFNFGAGCVGFGPMTGSVSSNNINMSIAGGSSIPGTTVITATSGQDAMSGTFTTSGGGCDNGDQGNFGAILIPSFASSQWSGNITPTSGAAVPLTGNLSEDATGRITGTVSLTGQAAPCNTITVTGTQTGRQLIVMDSQGLLDAGGEIDQSNKIISGGATGSCVPGGVGDFSMTRPERPGAQSPDTKCGEWLALVSATKS
jgi:hypothetical protein